MPENVDMTCSVIARLPKFPRRGGRSARNLQRNPQILNIGSKRAAKRPGMVAPWGRSSRFNFGSHDCDGGCSRAAGGWNRRRPDLPSSPSRNATRRRPSPRLGISPSSIPGNNNMSRSEEHTSELQSPDHLVCRLLLEKKKKTTERKERKNQ